MTLLDKISERPLFQQEKKMKQNSGNFEIIFSKEIFFQKIFINSLYSLKVGIKHTEAENQFLFNLRKALISLQWLYLPSGLSTF